MTIIQQDFTVSSRLLFAIFLAAILCVTKGISEKNSNTIGGLIFNVIAGGALIWLFVYATYQSSFSYEFKQKELVVCLLFGLLGKKSYEFKDLKKIELVNTRSVAEIILYFECQKGKRKISINTFQANLGKVRLFLFANVENFEEIFVENERG